MQRSDAMILHIVRQLETKCTECTLSKGSCDRIDREYLRFYFNFGECCGFGCWISEAESIITIAPNLLDWPEAPGRCRKMWFVLGGLHLSEEVLVGSKSTLQKAKDRDQKTKSRRETSSRTSETHDEKMRSAQRTLPGNFSTGRNQFHTLTASKT